MAAYYADYNFYTEEYCGNDISEDNFNRLAIRASDKLDQLTFDRLVDNFPSDDRTATKVKKAVCALAEVIQSIEQSKQANSYETGADGTLKGRTIASISAGSESISFANNNAMAAVAIDVKAQETLYLDTVRPYLQGTGLLYAGI